MVAKYLLHGN